MTKIDNVRGTLLLLAGIAASVLRSIVCTRTLNPEYSIVDIWYILIMALGIIAAAGVITIAVIRLKTEDYMGLMKPLMACMGIALCAEIGLAVKTAFSVGGAVASIVIYCFMFGGYIIIPVVMEIIYNTRSARFMYRTYKSKFTSHQLAAALTVIAATCFILLIFSSKKTGAEQKEALTILIASPAVMVMAFICFCMVIPPKYWLLTSAMNDYRLLVQYQKLRYPYSEYSRQTKLTRHFLCSGDIEGWVKYAEYEAYAMLDDMLPGRKKFLICATIPAVASKRNQEDQPAEIICFWRNRIIIVAPRYEDRGITCYTDPEAEYWRSEIDGKPCRDTCNYYLQNERRKRNLTNYLVRNNIISADDDTVFSLVYISGFGIYQPDTECGEEVNVANGGFEWYGGRYYSIKDAIYKLERHSEGTDLSPEVKKAYEALKKEQKNRKRRVRMDLVDMKKAVTYQTGLTERYIARNPGPDRYEFYRVTEIKGCKPPVYYERLTIDSGNYYWQFMETPSQAFLNECREIPLDIINRYVNEEITE